MNEQDEKMLGKALGRAVEAQPVRETRFEESRLAAELTHPGGFGFPLFRFAAAAAVVVLVLGAAYVAQQRTLQGPGATPTPTQSAPAVVTSPTPIPSPTGTPLPGHLNHSVVYCARNGAPPFALDVSGITGASPETRIQQRLEALQALRPLGPTEDGPCPMGFPSSARIARVVVNGDLAQVDYTVPGDDWQHDAMSQYDPLIAEIVFTASEEPGIRQVWITQNGGQAAQVRAGRVGGGLTPGFLIKSADAREDVLGYAVTADSSFSVDGNTGNVSATRWSVDDVAPGVARYVIELAGVAAEPKVNVTATRNNEAANPDLGKWVIAITLEAGGATASGTTVIDKTPLRSISIAHGIGNPVSVTLIQLGLDDLRPWRVGYLANPTRLVIDIGAPTSTVAANLVGYKAEVSGKTIHVTGAARAFEAHVSWRIKDSSGRQIAAGGIQGSIGTSPLWGIFDTTITAPQNYSGDASLELFLVSAKDGSDTNLVSMAIQLR